MWLRERALGFVKRSRGKRGRTLSVKDRVLQSDAVNWAANYLTPRNMGRYLGHTAMETAIEIFWSRQRRAGDLTAVVSDHFVRSGATVIDVGASWGLFTYHLARRVGEGGLVYSYEPHPANAVVLQKLAKARPYVHFRPVAVSDAAGRAELLVPKRHSRLVTAQASLAHGFEGVGVEGVEVPTVRLDDEIGGGLEVDFVKIDVEGHEMFVLRGGASMFRRCLPPVLIEIEQRHLAVPIRDIFCELEELGYHLFYIDESVLRPIANFDVQRDQLSKLTKDQFNPFSMPRDYVCNFCAVRTPHSLQGLPVAR
jgi:FkbM family methyltransferase